MTARSLALALALLAAPIAAAAGDLTPQAAGEVTDQIIKGLDTYVDPTLAARAQASLKAHRADYQKLDSRAALAASVTHDLYEATHDQHLKLKVNTLEAGKAAEFTEADQALVDRHIAYGFMAARRLPGNIGYLKLRYFEQGEAGAAMLESALGLLKDTDALIIDLRENTGGGGVTDETLLGELSRTPIPMAGVSWRNPDGTETLWRRQPRAPSGEPLYADKPVYVLTSKRTFSAAEGFAYALQAAHRAVLVGETTRGGANAANRRVPLSYGFGVFIPNGRAVHPTTGSNWDGVGVAPDIATPADQALTVAYGRALATTKPKVATPMSVQERAAAIADPRAALLADAAL